MVCSTFYFMYIMEIKVVPAMFFFLSKSEKRACLNENKHHVKK